MLGNIVVITQKIVTSKITIQQSFSMMSSFEPVGLAALIKKERPEESHARGDVSGRCCAF